MTQIDQSYLRDHQYRDASNLDARIALHRRFSTNDYPFTRWEFDHYVDPAAGLPERARVLELGTGPATLWRENLPRVPSGWSITLTDLSPGMLEEARQNLGDAAERFNFQEVDAQALPFGDEAFDAVIANHMLYHVPDRPLAIREIARVLGPGGRLFAATNGSGHVQFLRDLRKKFGREDWSRVSSREFTLENGGEQLAPFFVQIEIDRFESALLVDEVEPLVAYVQSMEEDARETAVATALRAFVEQEMAARNGTIRIENNTGMFTARK